MHFKNRREAGMMLAEKLKDYRNEKAAIVLAIPRGGVEVGYEIAKSLKVKLDVIVTKKIGLPGNEEFAIGSVGPDKKVILDEATVKVYNVSEEQIHEMAREIGKEIERRYKAYKGKYELQNLKGKTIILTDDGIATGFTAKAAISYIKSKNPKKIILAVPVAPSRFNEDIKKDVDKFVCLHSADRFFAIGQFYDEFPQLSDEEVKGCLR
ncbi:phosphoribosyltransferase [Candidatus Woesearchaeota archaeon]|nr:phosphoribosyltransferase [Candidatus Woesearchaeota archaeon]